MAECLGDARKAAGCEICYVRPGGKRAGQRRCLKKIRQERLKWGQENRDKERASYKIWWEKNRETRNRKNRERRISDPVWAVERDIQSYACRRKRTRRLRYGG